MKEESDLRDVIVQCLAAADLFEGVAVPIVPETAIDDRSRPCVTVEVIAAGRLVPKLVVKSLKVQILTQRNDTAADVASGWADEVCAAIEAAGMWIAGEMFARGWLIKGFALVEVEDESGEKRGWTGGLTWRIVLCRV